MTYYPPIIDSNYYARNEPTGNFAVSIDSMPRYNALTAKDFTAAGGAFNTPQNTVVISTAIRPQITISGVQYIDFYSYYSGTATTKATLRFRIRQFDVTGKANSLNDYPSQLGGVVNTFGSSGAGFTTGDQIIDSLGVTKYTLTFGSSFTLEAGATYFVDIQSRNTVNPTATTWIVGSTLGTADETFYRDRLQVSSCSTNTNNNSANPGITVPSAYAGILYPGIRVVHASASSYINGSSGANVVSCPSGTTAILDKEPTTTASGNQTLVFYDLNRFITAGADTFTYTAGSGTLPRVLDFIPLFQLRGTG